MKPKPGTRFVARLAGDLDHWWPAPMRKPTSTISLYIVATAYSFWIFAVWGVFYLTHAKDENALQFAVICGAIPAACQIFLLGIDWRGLVAPTKIWLALLLVILVSYVVNAMNPQTAPSATEGLAIPAAWTPIIYTINTIFITMIGTLVAACPDRRLMRSIGGIYCIISTPFLIYIDLTGEMLWGRLVAGDLQPNNWGLMGFTVCLGALARKPGIAAATGFIVGLATILQASSREHLLALAIVLLVVMALYFSRMNSLRLWAVLTTSCVSLILVALLLDPYILDAINYVKHDVLLINSPNRGIDSGFTGRTGVWRETFDLWLRAPLFGIGFRQHEQFLAGTPAHNAYLAMLADTGLLGLIVYVVLLVRSLIASWGIEDRRTRRFVVATIVGYIIIGFFDRRAINAGNPYGLLILMCCSVALVDQSLRRATELYRRSAVSAKGGWAADPPLPTS